MLTKKVAVLLAAFGLAAALPSLSASPDAGNGNVINVTRGDDGVESIVKNCINNGACNKFKLYMMADQALEGKGTFKITEGITIVKSPDAVPGDGAPRSLSAEDIQKTDLFSLVVNRAERFLRTHTFKFDLKGTEVLDAVASGARALGDATDSFGLTGDDQDGEGEESARKKVKKAGKILLPLLIMLKMKAAALIPVALGAIALIAGKALLIGKIALLLSGIIALKKLLSSQHKSVTYEIVSHPHHTSSHEHHGGHDSFSSGGGDLGGGYGGGHGGGWGRSADAAQDLAYRSYAPQQAANQ
ncbi:Osiris 7 [Nesidiocoris tenuis]|uniref:Osiris 7 n=2 Tax=Nesidiocoris tenuis TaxID=355587 RepID=A0ABN7AWW0_9HEMI|nr:Osiris 7 [Nesidiocoris tenuis]